MNITINGKKTEQSCRTVFEIRKQMGNETDIVILNGFLIEKDREIAENDVLFLIPKGTMPDEYELESMLTSRNTPNIDEKLKKGRVAIAGLGGVGSNIAVMLARMGVGKLLLVDYDTVDPSNLNRQYYNISHLGMLKTAAMKKQIGEINPFIDVEIVNIKVTKDNIVQLFTGYDIICEAFDRAKEKCMLINAGLSQLVNVKIVASSGLAGHASSNSIKTVKATSRLYLCGDLESGARVGQGLMAPRVQICAGHQANMVLRLLLGMEDV